MKTILWNTVILIMFTSTVPLSCGCWGQTTTANKTSDSKPPQGDQKADGGAAPGFSMESEMLTYAALERDSDAVACDIAEYLTGDSVHSSASSTSSPCPVITVPNSELGVLILSSNSKAAVDFALWRAYMAAMDSLLFRARYFKCQEQGGGAGQTTQGLSKGLPTLPGLVGEVLPLVQSVLATTESSSPVRGTIEDQAFVNNVARRLRVLGIHVLIPDTYMPLSFAAGEGSQYPFVVKIEQVYAAQSCLLGIVNQDGTSRAEMAAANALLGDVNALLTSVFGSEVSTSPKSQDTQGSDQTKAGDGGDSKNSAKQIQTKLLLTFSSSHFASLLSADLLAKELKIDLGSTGLLTKNDRWHHILRLKAVESGGSVGKTESFLRKKLSYSGGAVVTYALFNIEGELECSGDVYAYGGPLLVKDLHQRPRAPELDPRNSPVVLEGRCKSLAPQAAAEPRQ